MQHVGFCGVHSVCCAGVVCAVRDVDVCAVRGAVCAVRSVMCAVHSVVCAVRDVVCAVRSVVCVVRDVVWAVHSVVCAVGNSNNCPFVYCRAVERRDGGARKTFLRKSGKRVYRHFAISRAARCNRLRTGD